MENKARALTVCPCRVFRFGVNWLNWCCSRALILPYAVWGGFSSANGDVVFSVTPGLSTFSSLVIDLLLPLIIGLTAYPAEDVSAT